MVVDFLEDIADGDVAAVCAILTPTGRAQAIARATTIGKPLTRASLDECVAGDARGVINSSAFPDLVARKVFKVTHTEIDGASARVVLTNGALTGVQRLKKTDAGWKIDQFELPYRN